MTKYSSDSPGTENCSRSTASEPTSYDTWPASFTSTPYPRFVKWNGTFL